MFGRKKSKITVEEAGEVLREYSKTNKTEEEFMFFRGSSIKKGFEIKNATMNCSISGMGMMLENTCERDSDFKRVLLQVAENVKKKQSLFEDPKQGLKESTFSELRDSIQAKFPDAEVVSINLEEIKDMPEEDFQKIIDKMYKASQNEGRGLKD